MPPVPVGFRAAVETLGATPLGEGGCWALLLGSLAVSLFPTGGVVRPLGCGLGRSSVVLATAAGAGESFFSASSRLFNRSPSVRDRCFLNSGLLVGGSSDMRAQRKRGQDAGNED